MTMIYMIGGKGDMSGRDEVNGGGYNPSLRTWDEAQGADGAYLVGVVASAGEGAVNNGGNYVRLTGSSGDFTGPTGSLLGVVANVLFTSIYDAGHYEIMGTDNDTWIDINLAYSENATTDAVLVGGAYGSVGADTGEHLQWGLDILDTGDTLKIRDDITFNLNSVTVDCDGNSGERSNRITVEGVDTDGILLVAGASKPTIQPFGNITGALVEVSGNTDFWDWRSLNFNGTNGVYTADYGLYCNEAACQYHRISDCELHDTDKEALYWIGDRAVAYNCECYGAASLSGCYWGSYGCQIMGSSFHDNAVVGLTFNSTYGLLHSCEGYNNGSHGIAIDASQANILSNTCYGNDASGFFLHGGGHSIVCYNNTSVENTLYGFDLHLNITRFGYLAYNHSHGNGSGHYSEGDDDSWADAGQGNNVSGDPLFTSITGSLSSFDHAGPLEYTVTDASGPFYAGMVGKSLHITDDGEFPRFMLGRYGIVSYTSATEIALDADPTGGGGDDTGGAFVFIDNFTPKYNSPLLGAGFPDSFEGGIDGRYTNYAYIGAVARKEIPAHLRGGRVSLVGEPITGAF